LDSVLFTLRPLLVTVTPRITATGVDTIAAGNDGRDSRSYPPEEVNLNGLLKMHRVQVEPCEIPLAGAPPEWRKTRIKHF
jgi:hypothetical protein